MPTLESRQPAQNARTALDSPPDRQHRMPMRGIGRSALLRSGEPVDDLLDRALIIPAIKREGSEPRVVPLWAVRLLEVATRHLVVSHDNAYVKRPAAKFTTLTAEHRHGRAARPGFLFGEVVPLQIADTEEPWHQPGVSTRWLVPTASL